jgi:hypothetical protein
MVRSLTQWTKTLSFPARISPQKHQQHQVTSPQNECSVINTPTVPDNMTDVSNDNTFCAAELESSERVFQRFRGYIFNEKFRYGSQPKMLLKAIKPA